MDNNELPSEPILLAERILGEAGRRCSSEAVASALRDLGGDRANSLATVELFLRSIIRHSRLAARYLRVADPDIIGSSAGPMTPMNFVRLCKTVCKIAARYAHNEVTEMHFLMGVLTLHESAIALAFQPLVEEERRRCDVGEKPQSLSLADCRFRKAEDRLSAENFDNATRYGIVNIRQKIIHYVASGFYPYDEIQWERFNRERETAYANALSFDTPKDEVEAIKRDLLARADATLAFLIHQTEAELGPKEHKQVRK